MGGINPQLLLWKAWWKSVIYPPCLTTIQLAINTKWNRFSVVATFFLRLCNYSRELVVRYTSNDDFFGRSYRLSIAIQRHLWKPTKRSVKNISDHFLVFNYSRTGLRRMDMQICSTWWINITPAVKGFSLDTSINWVHLQVLAAGYN